MPTGSLYLLWSKDYKRLISSAVRPLSGGLWRRGGLTSQPLHIGNKDHKWLVNTGYQHLFDNEDDKRLVPSSFCHSIWSHDDKRLVPPALGTCWGGLARAERGVPYFPRRSKDQKWLLHSGYQHSFGSEDDKVLVPTCCWNSYWREH